MPFASHRWTAFLHASAMPDFTHAGNLLQSAAATLGAKAIAATARIQILSIVAPLQMAEGPWFVCGSGF